MSGHEESKAWGQGEDRAVSEHDDLRGDYEQGMRHRELHQDGTLKVGHEHEGGIERSEYNQRVEPYENRLQRASIAGVLVRARGGDSDKEWEGVDVHHAKNEYMERGASSGAKRAWKPKGREAAERASRDV